MATQTMRSRMTTYIEGMQREIVAALEAADPGAPAFQRRAWDRAQGGHGVSCTFTAPEHPASVLEKAGVNISMIHGTLPPAAIKQMAVEHASLAARADASGSLPFFAGGLSIVVHPRNPSAPTVHANYRYFEVTAAADGAGARDVVAWWFGGITDLTPNYLFEEDVVHWHRTLKAACDAHGPQLYPAFKANCDGNFFIKHREEHRGVGGIRFDDLCDEPHTMLPDPTAPRPRTPDEIFAFVQACAGAFLPSYLPILERRKDAPVDERKRRWQLIRRGRYIEFNLVYERGTKFGLATPGVQAENVLMSLPETARWEYMSELGTEEGSEEEKMLEVLKSPPREWV
ncbi:coproporphyrinogen III oxidase [Phanerochaete sordida]|uniref:coproporphyrinogen oxidase n=1 Tax=Phanerochaete sordida TaxID=48140 RepID=A0A9P3GJF4_9APHY|nr:coproporphyrinogen III oxidase [Phanerochaete sordida]